MLNSEIKPCPFCGGIGEIEYEYENGFFQKYYSWIHVVCQRCYATTGRSYDDNDRSRNVAIRRWNKRA